MTAAILLVAIVAEDPAVMRNAPRDDAAPQATLWRGDWLEVRGERPGSCRSTTTGTNGPATCAPRSCASTASTRRPRPSCARWCASCATPPAASRWASATRRSTCARRRRAPTRARSSRRSAPWRRGWRGARRRGAPTGGTPCRCRALSPRGVDGGGADRGRRELRRPLSQRRPLLAGGRARLCYDGEAWERVLASPAAPPLERARAALFLAGGECLDPALAGRRRGAPGTIAASRRSSRSIRRRAGVPAYLGGARAAAPRRGAGLARLRRGATRRRRRGVGRAPRAAAIRELALVDRGRARARGPRHLRRRRGARRRLALGERGAGRSRRCAPHVDHRRAARRRRELRAVVEPVGRGRGREGARARRALHLRRGLAERAALVAGGQRRDAGGAAAAGLDGALGDPRGPAQASAAPANGNGAAHVAWTSSRWSPATVEPEAGYVEAAGFSPDGAHLLVVREARGPGHPPRRFQVLSVPTLAVEKQANSADGCSASSAGAPPGGAPARWRCGDERGDDGHDDRHHRDHGRSGAPAFVLLAPAEEPRHLLGDLFADRADLLGRFLAQLFQRVEPARAIRAQRQHQTLEDRQVAEPLLVGRHQVPRRLGRPAARRTSS